MEWATFLATLVGAGVSIATSLCVFGFTSWIEARRRADREKKAHAFQAFRGLQKLISIANDLTNVQRHLNEAFDEAREHGLEDAEPFVKVKPIIGAELALHALVAEEMFFLVDQKHSHVMGEIELIFHRALNVRAVVEQFNRMRLEFGQFLESRTKAVAALDGTRVAFELEGNDAKLADLRGGAMNNLLGQLMEHLDRDCVEAKRLAELFHDLAQTHFNDAFPKVKLEWSL